MANGGAQLGSVWAAVPTVFFISNVKSISLQQCGGVGTGILARCCTDFFFRIWSPLQYVGWCGNSNPCETSRWWSLWHLENGVVVANYCTELCVRRCIYLWNSCRAYVSTCGGTCWALFQVREVEGGLRIWRAYVSTHAAIFSEHCFKLPETPTDGKGWESMRSQCAR